MKICLIKNKKNNTYLNRKGLESILLNDSYIYTTKSARWRFTYLKLPTEIFEILQYDLDNIVPKVIT
jgi:hypothetical protein